MRGEQLDKEHVSGLEIEKENERKRERIESAVRKGGRGTDGEGEGGKEVGGGYITGGEV